MRRACSVLWAGWLLLPGLLFADVGPKTNSVEPAEPPDAGPPVVIPLAVIDGEKKKLKPKEVEKAIKEAIDKANGVVPETGPVKTEVGGVPTDKFGDSLPEIKAFPVRDVMGDPELFDGQRLLVRGVVRRTAVDGSWLEIAEHQSAAAGIRILPGPGWHFFFSDNPRRVTAYGTVKRVKINAREARKLDEDSNQKPKGGARVEWRLEAEGAEVQWLD